MCKKSTKNGEPHWRELKIGIARICRVIGCPGITTNPVQICWWCRTKIEKACKEV